MTLKNKHFENILGKGEYMLVTSIFCFSNNVFCTSPQKIVIFFTQLYFVVCKFFQLGPV